VTLPVADILQPLEDIASALIKFLHDDLAFGWGMAIVGLTVIVRLAILPLTYKQVKSMNALRALQPQMKEVQEKYKDDRQRQQQELMKFFKEHNVSPFSSCWPLLLQLPVFFALFQVLRGGGEINELISDSAQAGWLFIGNLAEKAQGPELLVLIVVYVASQLSSTMVMGMAMEGSQKYFMYILPVAFVPIIITFPAGLILYWITTNLWTLGQQLVVRRIAPPLPVAAAGASGGSAAVTEKRKPPAPPRKRKRRHR
jgi:YidC/Oxa1 family membrane protein insertase